MAHLKQKQISDSSCRSIIVDTLLETVQPITQKELSNEIASLFHVLVTSERLSQQIKVLADDGTVIFDVDGHISINPVKKPDFIFTRLQETNLRKEATLLWISDLQKQQDILPELENMLSQALPIFLRSVFVRHGVSSFELLTSTSDPSIFDLKLIASTVAQQFDDSYMSDIENLLPSVFLSIQHAKVVEYLKHSIEKAVGYISEVISEENLTRITAALKDLTVYLDTNTIYRLLNLQGTSRYESIKETLDFCRKSGIKLRVSAITKKELTSRLKYDAKVLIKFPTKTDLTQAGYKYRTTDNYVSTYWLMAKTSKISVEDFIAYYQNFDILLDAEQIVIEDIEVDEEALISRAKNVFSKMSLRDPLHEKGDFGLWHDAYNYSYVQKMQKADAKNAVDTRCLFLTTDKALTSFQREDHDAKNCPPVVIAPSQLLQMFAFSTVDSGYEETFIKFFASSSLGATFKYDNDDIQEILFRIGHYSGVSPEIAERILSRELVNSRYLDATDEEREEIIYNSISNELLSELNLTKEQVADLRAKNIQLDEDCKVALDLMTENEAQYSMERLKLEEKASEAIRQRDAESNARRKAEDKHDNIVAYSAAQEELYINEKIQSWKKKQLHIFWTGILLSFGVVALSIFLWLYLKDSGCLSVLGALALTVLPIISARPYSTDAEIKTREKILEEYHKKLK